MVLLTVTPAIVEGLQTLKGAVPPETWKQRLQSQQDEPSLEGATVGGPVSHSQVVDLWRALKDTAHGEYTLEKLLKGSKIYVPPPTPKPEPSDEYKALMARLRREQEQREYERMANPLPPMETFSQRFPNGSSMAQTFAAVNRPSREEDIGDDDITFNDVHRQLMLILNFLASILGVAATLWILARWWSTPARLFLTMGGSILVGIAEVAVYSGYVWHLGQAKKQDRTLREVKEIVQTWTVGTGDENIAVDEKPRAEDKGLRSRHKDLSRRQ
ncbi:endoplasmic reticulum-based factor for assembly of V-ATPase-domain-containing protein [Achaetomium macrosporum]|uniref:Endoplasmic reticulum-based factor for assembly of V-ATPase-domain-containing protein n=1 Tax=Achaetomium macrosporum TaxID=79813 RepID=A0AAN7C4N6_9PEZI|nr:endoplasmic reticulum-based factor for assembly of V-ATPase-domain-containing protein [Achaetomium macrosporum]